MFKTSDRSIDSEDYRSELLGDSLPVITKIYYYFRKKIYKYNKVVKKKIT